MKIKTHSPILIVTLSLLSLYVIQYYLFKNFVYYEIINFYPSNFDQASYLMFVYRIFEDIKQLGIGIIFSHNNILSTGILFPPQALLYFLLFGANRFSALLPNFFYFILLQTTAFFTIKKILGNYSFAFILLGLILAIETPFFYAGGITDFRMDFIAFNLYGTLACLFLLSQNFLSRKWVFLIGLNIILLVLMRFITFIYLLPTAAVVLFQAIYNNRKSEDKNLTKKRLVNLSLLFAVMIIFLTPFIMITKNGLYQYYVISHLSEKAFRGFKHDSIWQYITFYPVIIKNYHIGLLAKNLISFLWMFSLIGLILAKIIPRKNPHTPISITIHDLFILSLMVIFPVLILMLDPSTSSVVGGIIVIPLLLWIVIVFAYMTINITSHWPFLLNGIAAIFIFFGLLHQWHFYITNRDKKETLQDSAHITQFYETIGNYATQHHWSAIHLSTDFVTDYLNYGSFLILYYEKHGELLKITTERLGSHMFSSISQEEALASLKSSNVIILTAGKFPSNKEAFFPGMQSIVDFRPALAQYAKQNFTYLGHYAFKGYDHDVYVR